MRFRMVVLLTFTTFLQVVCIVVASQLSISASLPIFTLPEDKGWNTSRSVDSAQIFYELALQANPSQGYSSAKVLHLVRIPKASSTPLSTVSRHIAGCFPAGPCCKYPGTPRGTCPLTEPPLIKCEELGKVIGCTHHFPNYKYLLDPSIISITVMREPLSRAISAFFYPGIHHNSRCTANAFGEARLHKCFLEYTAALNWQNIAVKLFSGEYAYRDVRTCNKSSECTNSLELALSNLPRFSFAGISEVWPLSLLVMHIKVPTARPLLAHFQSMEIANKGAAGKYKSNDVRASRVNTDDRYLAFRVNATSRYQRELNMQNGLDVVLYRRVAENLCTDLHRYGLWRFSVVRDYWASNAKYFPPQCPKLSQIV